MWFFLFCKVIIPLIKNFGGNIPSTYFFVYKLYTWTKLKTLKYYVHYVIGIE